MIPVKSDYQSIIPLETGATAWPHSKDLCKDLQSLGLSFKESLVFLHVAWFGSSSTRVIADSIHLSKLETYRSIRKLMNKGLVESSLDNPKKYSAITIEKALDILTEDLRCRIRRFDNTKSSFLKKWRDIKEKDETPPTSRFKLIRRRDNIYRFESNFTGSAKNEICTMATKNEIIYSINLGKDDTYEECVKRGCLMKCITDIDESNVEAAKRYLEFCELRHLAKNVARLIIIDNEVLTYLTYSQTLGRHSDDEVALWTNNKDYTGMMANFFEMSWGLAMDGRQRILQLENDRSTDC